MLKLFLFIGRVLVTSLTCNHIDGTTICSYQTPALPSFITTNPPWSGYSHRLGNTIDAWFFSQLGSRERKEQFEQLTNGVALGSLSGFMKTTTLKQIRVLHNDVIVAAADDFWASYDIDILEKKGSAHIHRCYQAACQC